MQLGRFQVRTRDWCQQCSCAEVFTAGARIRAKVRRPTVQRRMPHKLAAVLRQHHRARANQTHAVLIGRMYFLSRWLVSIGIPL